MKSIKLFSLVSFICFLSFTAFGQSTGESVLKNKIAPAELLKTMDDPKSAKPILVNTGPMGNVKYAIGVGACSSPEGIAKLKREAYQHAYEKPFVVYCGCCTLDNCPNVKPAVEALNSWGYKNVKVLDLPVGLAEDWIQKGFPMK